VSWQLGAFGLLAVALVTGFAWYELERPDARIVALVGTLAAFAALGRIAFAPVPNVKPTTDIVLISGYALGGGPGFAVGALAGLTSNFFFGQGPWTPWQMAAWGVTGVIGAALAWVVVMRGPRPIGRWPLAIVCCVVGFAFTAVQDVGDWVTYSDHSWAQLGVYVGKGLGFDAVHAAGCLVFALAFGPALIRSISRFARRLQVTWLAPGAAAPLIGVALALGAGLAVGLHAPASARAATSPVGYLRAAQNADGGFGAAPGQASAGLYTGWAALGLAAAGEDLRRVSRGSTGLLTYIGSAPGMLSDVGSLERTILVAHAGGASPRHFGGHDLVALLQRHIRANGSVSGQVNLTAFAVLALRAAGVAPAARTYAWLVGQQDSDGGFSFAGAGGSSDVDDTGSVLEALAGRGGSAAAARRHAVAYLRRQQDRDGGFPQESGGGSNAQSTAWAVQGLDAVRVSPSSLHRGGPSPLAYLHSLVRSNGAIRYSRESDQTPVWVTGEVLMALQGKPLPVAPPPSTRVPLSSTPAASPSPSPSPSQSSPSAASPAAAETTTSASSSSGPQPVDKRTHAAGSASHHAAGTIAAGTPDSGSSAGGQIAGLASVAGLATALVLAPIDLN
jgi:energy-coupling factor transport system substrate-specific component